MIAVTRLDGTPMIISSDQIAWIEFNPDTVIALNNGEKLIVQESPNTVVDRVKEFKRTTGGEGRRIDRPKPGLAVAESDEPW